MHKRPITVKIVTRQSKGPNFPWARQCPGNRPEWGDCRFIADPHAKEYDWYVAIDDVPRILPGNKEKLACPREHTILLTSEPSAVTRYGHNFVRQFATVITNHEAWALPHPNAIRSQTGNIWFYGKNYEEITNSPLPEKTELISTVCSSKRQAHTMHARRYDFTWKLKAEIPELEIFGHGVRFVEKKYQALDPYRFHLVIENHRAPHLWTEKLADAFLACTVPIYCGAPNVFDYFPEESLVAIDIDDFDSSLAKVRSLLENPEEYERRLPAVLEARRRVLEEYNLPAMLHRIISQSQTRISPPGDILYGRRIMRMKHPEDLLRFCAWKTGNLLKKVRTYLP